MTVENNSIPLIQASTGVILKVEHRPHTAEGESNTHFLLKGHPLPAPHRDLSIHRTSSPQLTWHEKYCIYCQQCQQVCPRGCLHQTEDGLAIDRENCIACGDCVKQCPSLALEVTGLQFTAADLLHKTFKQNYTMARKIKHVTVGGGEPGLQSDFCADLLFQLSAMGIPTTLQTTGALPMERYLPLIPYPTVIHYELITTDSILHKQITGYGNDLIMDNLDHFYKEKPPITQLVIRTPLLREQNTTPERLRQIGDWLKAHLPALPTWVLFEPRYVCDEFSPLNIEEIRSVYTSAIAHYPAQLVQIYNWKRILIQNSP